ncbi:hypothetical protein ABMA27_011289 [Loxostege sticticalis]|uniref:Uncharacterized protein n=1 Tax=Loxostege sticticalis TaxID=481309 RepID=A0ABR3H1Z0_LOXSC
MYTAHYKMNFTSRSVDVQCSSFKNNRLVINYSTLTLYRSIEAGPNLDTTKDSFTGSMPIQPLWIWVAIGSGVLIIVVLVACSIMVFKKGKREEAMIQRASVNYEHFTNDAQEPTPPFPRGAKLEQTYLAPVDLEESPYAISRPQDTDTYALPYTPSTVEELYSKPVPKTSRINALYSQILPKSLRGNQNSSKYVNSGAKDELQYAEIGHPSKNYANVQDKSKEKTVEEDNYAEILHRSDDYANLNGQKTGGKPKDDNYTNVFSNDPYVNAKRDDYAEPSYCELSRKN